MHRIFGILTLTAALAACSMSMSPEQSARLDREYRPVVNAFIPACVATASGRQADYAAIEALGYVQRKAATGAGDYLYPAGKNPLLSNAGIRFVPGKGCYAGHDGVSGVALGGMDEIGQVWTRALQDAGYPNVGGSASAYSFTANRQKLNFRGTFSSNNGLSFSITQAN